MAADDPWKVELDFIGRSYSISVQSILTAIVGIVLAIFLLDINYRQGLLMITGLIIILMYVINSFQLKYSRLGMEVYYDKISPEFYLGIRIIIVIVPAFFIWDYQNDVGTLLSIPSWVPFIAYLVISIFSLYMIEWYEGWKERRDLLRVLDEVEQIEFKGEQKGDKINYHTLIEKEED